MTWRVICTESRQEFRASAELSDRGFSVYYPLEALVSVVRGRKVDVVRPLFPGYIFAEPCTQWARLFSAPGVRGALPGEVSEAEMARIRHAETVFAERARQRDTTDIEPGETLRVVDGPFASFNAYVEAVDSDARITVLLNLFGRPTRTMVSATQLARI